MAAPTKDQEVLKKLMVLLLKGPVSMFELTSKLKVSERTIYRYFKHLNDTLLNSHRIARFADRPTQYWITK